MTSLRNEDIEFEVDIEDDSLAAPGIVHMRENKQTSPIDIPQQQRNSSQRHTNFTPPRSYNTSCLSPIPVLSLHSMTRSTSVPRELRTSYQFDVSVDISRCVESEAKLKPINWNRHSMLSEPNFRCDVVEKEIGRDLRIISDIFHVQSAGFDQGYDFVGRRDAVRYSSSYPGATRARIDRAWQGIIQGISPHNLNAEVLPGEGVFHME